MMVPQRLDYDLPLAESCALAGCRHAGRALPIDSRCRRAMRAPQYDPVAMLMALAA